MENNVILEMKDITKRFPGVLALDHVSFRAYKGEILALCGENGAGKSTLMKILSGSYPENSYEGEIIVDGKPCHFMNPAQSEKAGIGMIYQEISMHLDMTIAENMFIGRWPMKNKTVDWKKMNDDAKEYLELVGLEIEPDKILRQLGASQQQLVSIARALSKEPKILVLDEPTSPLTQKESARLFEILHNLKNQGIACILISHKMEEVFQNADRVAVLRDGKTVAAYSIIETDEQRVVKDMVGREMKNFYPKEQVAVGQTVMEVRNFSVPHPSIPGRKIIDDVSFELKQGEILGIAGLVGAGRRELVNAIFGKDPKLSGEIYIDGKKADIKCPSDAIHYGIALATEDRKKDGIVGNMSIKENITLPLLEKVASHGVLNVKKEQKVSKEYFDNMNIKAPDMETMVQQLSGGNQQKVVLAKWMARNPQILILDEPTRGIDIGAKYEIYKIMMDLVKRGVSIIMISSELPELISMADRIMVISDEKIRGILNAKEYSQEKIMYLSAMSGKNTQNVGD